MKVVIPLVLLALLLTGCGGGQLVGTDMGDDAAPSFTLLNQSAGRVSLSDFRGKVVVLGFLYTSCPDVCPIIAHKFGEVHDQLGADANRVSFVAITVDPEHDSVNRIRQYLDAQGLDGKLTFLTGSVATLRPIWKAYYVGVTPGDGSPLVHGASVYIIDGNGNERLVLDQDFAVSDLLHDVKSLQHT